MKAAWLLRGAAAAVLVGWAGGLVFAAVQLHEWDRDLVQTMLQIRADRTFRVRMAQRHEPIPREWYRAKALALLAAGDKLQDDSDWARFLPGAWPQVDTLRARVAQRIEREFSEIAGETIRRELDWRASQLTGVARDPATGDLLPADGCAEPVLARSFFQTGSAAQPAPELQALQAHLDAIEELDRAEQALAALESSAGGDAAASLRIVVHYALGAELPGPLSRSAAWLRQVLQPAEPARQAQRRMRLQASVRCSVGKRMAVLDARVFERNDLVAAEAALKPRLAELERPATALRPVAESIRRWSELVALVGQQEQLLAAGATRWIDARSHDLGPLHEGVLARVSSITLLGPDAAAQLRHQSTRSLERLQRQWRSVLVSGSDPALVWREDEGRLLLSPRRVALRDQLAALLEQPFMATVAHRPLPERADGAFEWDAQRLADALALLQVRRRFAAEQLPRFPDTVRTTVARVVDRQLAQQVEEAAADAMRPAAALIPAGAELAAWRGQRLQAARVQALLAQLGGGGGGAERLRQLLAADVAARLASAEDELAQSQLSSPRLQDFGWWRGDGSPILGAFAVGDALTLRYVLAQQVAGLDAARRRVAPLLQEAAGTAGGEGAIGRWQAIAADLDRYHAGRTDSSLLVLERALVTLAPDLGVGNCGERIAAAPPPRMGADPFAERHRRLVESLARRCGELRLAAPPAPGAPATAAGAPAAMSVG
jgi:type VI secretion system protein ImpL